MAAHDGDCKGQNLRDPARPGPIECVARRLGLDEGVDLFIDHIKVERGLARHTIEAYSRDLARLVGFVADRGRVDVDDVTSADLTDHLIALAGAGLRRT